MSDHPGIQEKADLLAHGRSLLERIDAFAPDNPPPQRRYRIIVDLPADTLDDVADVFDSIDEALRRNTVGGTSGGVSSGFHWEVAKRDDTNHDSWWAELQAWRASRV